MLGKEAMNQARILKKRRRQVVRAWKRCLKPGRTGRRRRRLAAAAIAAAALLLPAAFLLTDCSRPFMKHYSLPVRSLTEPILDPAEAAGEGHPQGEAVKEGIQIRLKDRDIILFRIREQWEMGSSD